MNCLALPECNIHKHKSKSLKGTVVLGPLVLADPDMRNSALQRGLSRRSDEDPKPETLNRRYLAKFLYFLRNLSKTNAKSSKRSFFPIFTKIS